PSDQTVREGDPLRLKLAANDFEGDALTFSSVLLPAGATLGPSSGVFEWTPAFTQAGAYSIPITVSDGKLSTIKALKVTVLNVNAPPVFESLGTFQSFENQKLTFRTFAFDPDNPAFTPVDRGPDGALLVQTDEAAPSVAYSVSGL